MGAFDQFKKQNSRTYQDLIHEMLKLPAGRHELVLRLGPEERAAAMEFLAKGGRAPAEPLIALNVGGGGRWKKKRWKEQHFVSFIRRVAAEHGAKVLIIGGEQEAALLERLAAAAPAEALTAGPCCSLRHTAALVSCCQAAVTGDTLAFHLAVALNVPAVVLLGPTSAAELDTYGRGEKIVAPISCVGCYLTDCAVEPDCMQLISPDRVLAAVARWLPPGGGNRPEASA
jgi:ADP-heptose:LPS heptosyltransferase